GVIAEKSLLRYFVRIRIVLRENLMLGKPRHLVADLAAVDIIRLAAAERGDEVRKPALMRRNAMGGDENENVAGRRLAAVIERPPEGEIGFLDVDDAHAVAPGDVEGGVRRA